MRPEVVRRIVAGYAIALGVLALILVPGHGGPATVSGSPHHQETQPPTPPTVPPMASATPAPPADPSAARQPEATRTHRTDRTPTPNPNRRTTAPVAAPSPPVVPRGASQPPVPAPTAAVRTTARSADGPPGDFAITSSNDLNECNGGTQFTVSWSRSEGATRYTVYASNQGSVLVSGTTTTLACPTKAGTFTVTVIAYNDRMQGTNAPTVTYHEPEPLDDPSPSPGGDPPGPTSTPTQNGVNIAPAPSASPTP